MIGDREDVVNIPGAPIITNLFIDNIQRRVLAPHLLDFKHKVVLDVGAGIGRWTIRFAEEADHVIGLDISREMIKIAKKKLKKRNVDFLVGAAYAIPLRSESVDHSFSCTCIQHIVDEANQRSSICEIARVTRSQILLLELMSSNSSVTRLSHYPTLIIPKAQYVSVLKSTDVKSIHYHGVDFLPLLKLAEQTRNFFLKKTSISIPAYGGSLKQRLSREAYQIISVFALLFSIPFIKILPNPGDKLTRHVLLVAKKRGETDLRTASCIRQSAQHVQTL